MSDSFIKDHNIPLTDCNSLLTVEALDGKPIGGGRVVHITAELALQVGPPHHEQIHFYVIHSLNNPVILGLPWLRTHNPHVSWKDGQIVQWDANCHKSCLKQITPLPVQTASLHDSDTGKLNVAAPLTSMTKRQSSRLIWSSEAVQAFQELKERFTSAPILRHPDPELPFIVEVDASSTGIGAVLSQRQGNPEKMYPCDFY